MKFVGLWLDHKTAVISALFENEGSTKTIHSKLSPRDKARHAPRLAARKQEDRREHIIEKFYGEVLNEIHDAHQLFLMGPGPAKKEFTTFLENRGFSGKVVDVVNADKMTDKQVAAQTRDYFKVS